MAADGNAITASTVSIGQTVYAYSFFLPKISEVRRAEPTDTYMRSDVLIGQIAAGSVSMAVGTLLSWMTGNPLPVYTTLFIAIVIAVIYQYAMLNGERVSE